MVVDVPEPKDAPLASYLFPYQPTAQTYVPGVVGAAAVSVLGNELFVQPPSPLAQPLTASWFMF